MNLYIKNMVCPRCIKAVDQLIKDIPANAVYVRLGEVMIREELNAAQLGKFASNLTSIGFELLDDNLKQQVDRIKTIVIDHIHYKEDEKFPFTEILSTALMREYSVISKLFSQTEGITIEQYVILQKIEKAKELITYKQMNLNEISFKLGYSSAAHLSAQFKKVTGLTPSQFKAQAPHHRKTIDNV
ncbi:MAG: helix-turn-helix transcriptional regulator [Sediminibacterium sp.]|nr:helix-turn-helix transcriptional regulator [Sediminibacterium sp.]